MENGSVDEPWGRWAEAWQREPPPGEGAERVEERVRRETRRRMIYAVFEALVALGLLAFGGVQIWQSPEPGTLVWGAAIWVFTLTAWAFALWNRRGTWAPPEQTIRSYLETSRERSRRDLRAVRFGLGLLAVEVLFVVSWYAWWFAGRPGDGSGWRTLAMAGGLLVAVSVVFAGWLLRRRRRAEERIRWVRAREAEMTGGSDPAGGA